MTVYFIKHDPTEGPGTIEGFLVKAGIPFQTIEVWRGERFPEKLTGRDAVVSLGGPMNVYENDLYPFLAEEDRFIKKLLSDRIPFLGICLGAQLLAKAAGAKVYRAAKEEFGWGPVALTETGKKDRFFTGNSHQLEVFQWHSDTFDLPASGRLLAAGTDVLCQAFGIGEKAYGLQFHVEVNESIIAAWFKTKASPSLARYREIKDKYQTEAERIYRNYFCPAMS
ncbi:MAG: type 1 glutamine amidotransferase [Candidatus Margulisbacteria bacterium]|nr:type 1 glutamine amidotransferase [Candidatus Margulisiibacteriota bacterium]MBU1616329.1 type 1 glutamine amidotransferase [Candidatus Margulisiibacteriota bacterium]MBU1867181.1 type 1 glutamine amidotransferase [Candidatus Margulisiibacteriota bacterium]